MPRTFVRILSSHDELPPQSDPALQVTAVEVVDIRSVPQQLLLELHVVDEPHASRYRFEMSPHSLVEMAKEILRHFSQIEIADILASLHRIEEHLSRCSKKSDSSGKE